MRCLNLSLVLLGLLFVFSCTSLKAPKYVGIGDVKVSDIINDSITITAGFDFYNPNRVGGKMVLNNLKAVVNNIDLGNIKSKEVSVPSKKDFTVPLEIKIAYAQIKNANKGLLNMIINTLLSNEIEVKLKGIAVFKKSLFKKQYPIDFTKKVKLVK